MIKIALVDDHKILVTTMSYYIESQIVGTQVTPYYDPESFLEGYKPNAFDLIILDLDLPHISGIEVAKRVLTQCPDQKILIISGHYNEQIGAEVKRMELQGYLPKYCEKEELSQAIGQILGGGTFYRNDIGTDEGDEAKKPGLLTHRELEILKLSADGMTAGEIAEKLFLSESTVKTHRKNIITKTGLNNLKEVIAKFEKGGWDVLT